MSEDYLWDMSGTDPEIEKLESALSDLSFKGGPAPNLPARRRALILAMSWPLFSLRKGLAMASIAIIVLGSLWMTRPNHNIVGVPDLVVEPKHPVIQTDETVNPPQPPVEGPKPSGRRDLLTADYKLPTRVHMTKPVHKETLIIVTPEEAAAYNKLMLALAITSSNLRIVRDSVAEIDNESHDKKSDK